MSAPGSDAGAPRQAGAGATRSSEPAGPRRADELCFRVERVDEQTVEAARVLAYAGGRVIERDGRSLYTWGEAARITLPLGTADAKAVGEVAGRLRAIRPLDGTAATGAPGPVRPGPIALGALAFDPDDWSELVVPRFAVIADGDGRRVVAVGGRDDLEVAMRSFPFVGEPPRRRPAEAPDRFELSSVRSHEDFRRRVKQAIEVVRSGRLDKVVMAREVLATANRPFRQEHLLERLRALHPSCCAFAVDGFVGASPELLVRRRGLEVVSQPLAGTVARSGDPDEDRHLAAMLLASEKERAEHRVVVEAILAGLGPLCAALDAPEAPRLLGLRNVAHLATQVRGSLAAAGAPSALELAAALHPTPAVGGWPRDEALDYLRKSEELDRGRYAGPVGFVDADGDGEWWIGIRSALVEGRSARLFAGVGLVAGSDPSAELAETQLKLQAMLAAAVRP